MIVICANELEGPTGYHKSVVELANGLHSAGYQVSVLVFQGKGDGSERMLPRWPLSAEVKAYALKTLPADGGRQLHHNYHTSFKLTARHHHWQFTSNNFGAIRQLNRALTTDDIILFTSAHSAYLWDLAIGDTARRARSILQIHGNYKAHFPELWGFMLEARRTIDRLQTVSRGLRQQFLSVFDERDVVYVPNFPGHAVAVQKRPHVGLNVVLPGSFQPVKNQLDAIRALALVDDKSVRLQLWGASHTKYANECRRLAGELGVADRVLFPGFGSASDVYGEADILLMASRAEAMPFALVEGTLNSLPIVSYDFEFGPREAVDDGESGFLVAQGDVEGMARAIDRLAADGDLRLRQGARAREIFDERFSVGAVTRAYEELLGPPRFTTLDIASVFAVDGHDPIAFGEITGWSSGSGARRRTIIMVASPVALYDVQLDTGASIRPVETTRVQGGTRIAYAGGGVGVISYAAAPGSEDRHYLATVLGTGDVVVLPMMRRDATYGQGTPPIVDTLHVGVGGVYPRLGAQTLAAWGRKIARKGADDVAWKVRQVASSVRTSAAGRAPEPAEPPRGESVVLDGTSAAGTGASQVSVVEGGPETSAALTPGAPQLTETAAPTVGPVRKAGRAVRALASQATSSLMSVVSAPIVHPSREVARHPQFPLTAGEDSFGFPINTPGGVQVANNGTPSRPTVSISGEYDWVELVDAHSRRRFSSPLTFGDLLDGVCQAEREFRLFDRTTRGGIHIWELARSDVIAGLAQALGLWGPEPETAPHNRYDGAKSLATAPSTRRVAFGLSAQASALWQDDQTIVIAGPSANGHRDVTESDMVWPTHEYSDWESTAQRRWVSMRLPDIDARPFEEALSKTLGVQVDLALDLRRVLVRFVNQRDFWTPFLKRVRPDEVLLGSSANDAGVREAARRAGALVADVQDSAVGVFHETQGILKPRYGAPRLYAWSAFWAERATGYSETILLPRDRRPFADVSMSAVVEPTWDLCLIIEPKVIRRSMAFLRDVVQGRPELRVVVASSDSGRQRLMEGVAAAGFADSVQVTGLSTIDTVRASRMTVGSFSTDLWLSAAMGHPTFVLRVPGYEQVGEDLKSGLFRLAEAPSDLEPYDVPAIRHVIFGADS